MKPIYLALLIANYFCMKKTFKFIRNKFRRQTIKE